MDPCINKTTKSRSDQSLQSRRLLSHGDVNSCSHKQFSKSLKFRLKCGQQKYSELSATPCSIKEKMEKVETSLFDHGTSVTLSLLVFNGKIISRRKEGRYLKIVFIN